MFRLIKCMFPLLLVGLLASCGGGNDSPSAAPTSRRILIDSIHAHNFMQDGLAQGQYDYHKINGFRLAFDFLKEQGVEHDVIREGELDAATLSKYGMLFVNLVSADLPPYTVAEIAAIKAYVEAGGSVFFITDHTNCYFHAYKLKPLFRELGMETFNETACEGSSRRLGSGSAWINIFSFEPHPVTQGLRRVAFQTGGPVDDRFGVAFTSDKGWADQWRVNPYAEGNDPGLYGNWARDEGERVGRLAVVAARTLGRGRIVVVGDQNIFADTFIRYADNCQLFLNSVHWLLGNDPTLAQQQAGRFRDWKSPRIICVEDFRLASFGAPDHPEFYHLYVYLQRRHWALADDDLSGTSELLVFAEDRKLADADVDRVAEHVRSGRSVVLLRAPGFAFVGNEGLTGQLAAKLGPPASAGHVGLAGVSRFEGGGRVFIVLRDDLLTNEQFPSPTTQPTVVQESLMRKVDDLIDEALKPGRR